ncbi:MAG: NUDIX hydrolase [Phycisphaerae bacterium]|nr:NUDIX hydrolase [Phycisphaerae bacterium]MDW8263589.1 NUDIX hydrolase [Phycisphaerales bacterium]
MLRFHATGFWLEGQVELAWQPSTFSSSSEVEAAIDTAWREAKSRLGGRLFDGPMCRLERWETTGDGPAVAGVAEGASSSQLRLFLSLTSYRIFLGTNMTHPELPDESRANPLGVSTLLITADGFVMLGRRSGNVAYYPHRLHPFAGSLEPPAEVRGGSTDATAAPAAEENPQPTPETCGMPVPDLFENARRELREELGLAANQITQMACLGLVEDLRLRHPEAILLARTVLSRRQIESSLRGHEHEGAWSCPVEDAGKPPIDPGQFTPVAQAALHLLAHDLRRATSGER